MAIQVIGMSEREKWDKIVRSFSGYDVYYLSGYVRAFQIHGDGEPQLIYYEDSESSLRGINVVMKRDIAEDSCFNGILETGTYFDYSTPYGYGGWLLENPSGRDADDLFNEYDSFCRDQNIVSEFVRFHPLVKNYKDANKFYEIVFLGETVAMDLSSPEVIQNNLKKETKKKIRKAERLGVRVLNGREEKKYQCFQDLYRETMDRNKTTQYYYFDSKFFSYIFNTLPNNTRLFYALNQDGVMLSANLVIMANGMMNGFLLGSSRDYKEFSPDNILLYEIAMWGCEKGYKWFHMGGGRGSANDSLLEFKKGFYNNELQKFYIGKRICNAEAYQKLVEIRKESYPLIEQSAYFPTYRTPKISGGGYSLTAILIASVIMWISLCAAPLYKEVR